ncbi:MAG TPA: PKD domain-containing protein, partial [Thermoplasmatales archaeon]|nr:PKD domain-containing protein [Thermoplasmatales archaeon]
TDGDGNILGQGSITIEIGVFDVLLQAKGPGTDWESEFCKITDFDENAETVTVNLRAIVDGENDNSNQHSDDMESSESTNTEENLQVSTLSSGESYIYHFNFGDGTEYTSKETQGKEYAVTHPYKPHATYTATVTVTDPETGVSNSDSVVIQIGSDLRCHLWVDDDYWAREKTVNVGDTLTFHAKVWYENEDNNPNNNDVSNDVSQNNNDLKVSTLDGGDVTFTYEIRYDDGTSDVIQDTPSRQISTAHSFSENGTYVVVLLVKDSNGNSDGDAVTIHVGGELVVDVSASPNILLKNGASSTITAKVRKKNSNPVNNTVDNNQQNTYYSNNDLRVSTLDDGGTYKYEFKFGDGVTESENSGSSCSKTHPYRTDKLVEVFVVRVDVTEVETGLTGFGRAVVVLVNLNAWLGAYPNPVKVGEPVTFEARADGPPGNNNYANNGQNDISKYSSRVTTLAGSEEFLYEFDFGDNGGGGLDSQPDSEENDFVQNNPTIPGGFHIHSLSNNYGTVTTLTSQTGGRVAHTHHIYSKPGVYTATVKITHIETGVSDTASVVVVVEGNLTADAGGPYSASKSVTISSSGGSSGGNSGSSSDSSHTGSASSHSTSGSHSSSSSSHSSSSASSSTTDSTDSTESTQTASTNTITTLIWQEVHLIKDNKDYTDIDDDDSYTGSTSGSGGGSGGSKTVSVTIHFDGSGSKPASQIKSYIWSFGDGKTGRGRRTTHTYKITVGGGNNGGNADSTHQNNYNNNFVTTLSQSKKTGETIKTGGSSSGSSGGGSRSYDVVRTFTVTLTVKDKQGNLDTDSTSVTITIHVTEKNNGNNNNNDNNDKDDDNQHQDSQHSNQVDSYSNNGGHSLYVDDNKNGLNSDQVNLQKLLSFMLKTLKKL